MRKKEIILHGNATEKDAYGNVISRAEDKVIFGTQLALSIKEHYNIVEATGIQKTIQLEIFTQEYNEESSFTVDGIKYRVSRLKYSDVSEQHSLLIGIRA